jgi:hypothetical protein
MLTAKNRRGGNLKLEISNLKGEANGIDATPFRVDGIADEFPG